MSGTGWSLPIWEALDRMSDTELIEMLPYIRDEEGQKVNLFQLRRYLNTKRAEKEMINKCEHHTCCRTLTASG